MRLMIRTAAVPVSALADLRYDKTWPSISRAAELDCWLRSEGRRLADELHDVIGAVTGPARGELVALRRAVYGQRRPSERAWNPAVRAHLSPDTAERISLWVLRHQLQRELMAELPATREREHDVVTARLRQQLATPAFRFGLAQGSPVLSEQLGKWLGDGGAVPQRQSVLRLVKYLARAAAKTSPYSTFTVSGLVPEDDAAGVLEIPGELRWTSSVELNVWLARRIVHALATSAAHRGSLQVRPNPSLLQDDDRYRFLSVTDGSAVAGTRRGDALDACVARAGDPGGCTVDELGAHLHALDADLEPAAVRRFVDRVIEGGLLCLHMPFPDQVDSHLGALAEWLERTGPLTPQARDVLDRARAVHRALADYPTLDDVRSRERVRGQVGAQVVELMRRAGAPDPDHAPRKNVFHENAVFAEPPAGFAPRAWRPLTEHLMTVRKLLEAVDPTVSVRAAMTDVFVDRYGPGGQARWLDFYQYLNDAMRHGCAVMSGPQLTALRDGPTMAVPQAWWTLPYAREQAARVDRVTELVFSRAAADGPHLRLAEPELAARLGFHPGPLDSVACYGQLADLDGRTGFVLNGVISGYGRGLSKVHRTLCQAGVADRFPAWSTTERAPGGELLVELDSLFGSSLNLRSRATRFELDYPLTTPVRDPADRIALADLDVVHEPGTGRLRLRAAGLGEWVRPMHGGLMATFWLPEPLRNLITLFGPTHTLMHAAIPLFLPRGGAPIDAPFAGLTGSIREAPRIRIGDVVLARRSWVVPASLVPRRSGGESDESFWVRLAAWHREHGLPERYYARSAELSSVAWDPTQKSRKPTYVDLASWPLVALLERAMAGPQDGSGGGMLVLTESLPEPADAPRYGPDQHVTELVVELPAEQGVARCGTG